MFSFALIEVSRIAFSMGSSVRKHQLPTFSALHIFPLLLLFAQPDQELAYCLSSLCGLLFFPLTQWILIVNM